MTKTCTTCMEAKSLDDFYHAARYRGGVMPRCYDCFKAGQKKSYQKNRAKYLPKMRARNLAARYGLTPIAFDSMATGQGGACAICGELPVGQRHRPSAGLVVDHNHSTGAVRGLLCVNCNALLGYAHDNQDTLRAAIAYLENC